MSTLMEEFLMKYPGYNNPYLDTLRDNEFPALIDSAVYADWTGAALPPKSLIEKHLNLLTYKLLGNPHSHHAPSAFAMNLVQDARSAVLKFFNANPDEYEVIFTQNASNAILLMQHYMFEAGELLLTSDNHNSVNGLREIAKRNGAVVRYSPINSDLSLNTEFLTRALKYPRSVGNKLFCYPAKSNYSGTVHSLEWVSFAQENGWDVMLDAAAYLANNRLDLSEVKPDFVPVSFYKIFGYPTGIGCLIIKKEKYNRVNKKWFAGGTILLVSVMKDFYALENVGYARFEDGTVNFAGIPAVIYGLDFAQKLGDLKPRVESLTSWLYDELSGMEHNGNSVVIYTNKGTDTVSFNIKKGDEVVNSWLYEQYASENGVYVRTGCFCNPGVNEKLLGYSIDSYENFYNSAIMPDQITIENLKEYSSGIPIGAVRASFGYANNFADVQRFAEVTKKYLETL